MTTPAHPPAVDNHTTPASDPRRLAQLFTDIAKRVEFHPGPLVIALSGGADSAAAAWLLAREERVVRAVHVNHSLPHSSIMAEAARSISTKLGMDLEEISIHPGAESEDAMRTARYRALDGHSRPDEVVITAHTADDQAETVLHNLLRGAGLDGIAGIPPRRGRFHRPLLAVWRSETRELATLSGLPWEDDPQNDDPRYLRNRIRRRLMPQLEAEYQPRLREGLVRMSSLAGVDLSQLESLAARTPIRTTADGAVELSCAGLIELPPAISSRVVRRALRRVRGPHAGAEAEVHRVLEVARKKTRRTELEGGITVIRSGDRLLFAGGG
ncbi:MAG: tRNA lysidine(34) synthetase TilS [Acidimicrobiia bacterium]|nr:tRNA lysidine(34) synthetase TilS [Acidimicrobiia bacterium]MXY75244.1 tRNA lysidine(34) synthetase TilS [Acidimicrobiia bacterium]MYA39328.1 tRNA lysidine(34) synthetase TilS [Acidimicrobiia bacterium]MYB79655.1 tRNA lysidine(34) synthetase TilS [Acidimicrobiia bacterium]MYD40276.1 tRNA lysidine(34) synthetase TilS [Acidimicrobiia bacterium]